MSGCCARCWTRLSNKRRTAPCSAIAPAVTLGARQPARTSRSFLSPSTRSAAPPPTQQHKRPSKNACTRTCTHAAHPEEQRGGKERKQPPDVPACVFGRPGRSDEGGLGGCRGKEGGVDEWRGPRGGDGRCAPEHKRAKNCCAYSPSRRRNRRYDSRRQRREGGAEAESETEKREQQRCACVFGVAWGKRGGGA